MIDLDKLAKTLNLTANDIKLAADKAVVNPMEGMKFVPKIMQNFQQLQSFGKLDGIAASADPKKLQAVREALDQFFKNTKTAQEKVGAMGAALFNNPQFKEVTANLERVKKQLDTERGGRVTKPEHEPM